MHEETSFVQLKNIFDFFSVGVYLYFKKDLLQQVSCEKNEKKSGVVIEISELAFFVVCCDVLLHWIGLLFYGGM